MNNKFYDIVVIGSSPLGILEAIYHSNRGEKVLIIDNSSKIGGAWKSISFPGISNVENAIHYLLPSEIALSFFEKKLKLKMEKIEGKKTIYNLTKKIYFFLEYDGILSKLLNLVLNRDFVSSRLKKIFLKNESIYFKFGSPSLIDCLDQKLKKTNVEVQLNKNITKIDFKDKVTLLSKTQEKIISKKIVCTNSSRLNNLFKDGKRIQVNEKIQKRPSIHLVLEENERFNINQLIFFNNPVIKYAHDITKFCSGEIKGKRILVIALKHEIKEKDEVFVKVHQILKESLFCSKKSKILFKKWTDVVLPRLFNEDLEKIKSRIGDQLLYLKTESLAHSIEDNYRKWITIKN